MKNWDQLKGRLSANAVFWERPRGASLLAGENGLMALGVEMSLIDEVNRDINTFSQSSNDEKECLRYADQKLQYALELLLLILNEVIRRIMELNGTCISMLRKLTDSTNKSQGDLNKTDRQTGTETQTDIEDSDFYKKQLAFFSFLRKAYYTTMKNEGTSEKFKKYRSPAGKKYSPFRKTTNYHCWRPLPGLIRNRGFQILNALI